VATRAGKPVRRPPNAPTPCRTCPKIPPGAEPRPENAVELTEAGWAAWNFYRECRAVGRFPDDPLVRAAAAAFRAEEDAAERAAQARAQAAAVARVFRASTPAG
jgi:hypothetical protein